MFDAIYCSSVCCLDQESQVLNSEITPYATEIDNPVDRYLNHRVSYGGFTNDVAVRVFGNYITSNAGGSWHVSKRDLFVQRVNSGPFVVQILSVNWANGVSSVTVSGTYKVTYIHGGTTVVLGVFDYYTTV